MWNLSYSPVCFVCAVWDWWQSLQSISNFFQVPENICEAFKCISTNTVELPEMSTVMKTYVDCEMNDARR